MAFKTFFRLSWGLILVSGLLSPVHSPGQSNNIGIPPVRNFPRKIYQAGTQSWDVGQDRRGVMYFANNNGLLQYDGRAWQCFPVSNGTIVRSLLVHTDGRIYVGAQGEIGYFFPDAAGRLTYHSLMALVPESGRNLEDVWDIQPLDGAVFFRSNQLVLRLEHERIEVFQPGGLLEAMAAAAGRLYVQQGFQRLLRFDAGRFVPVCALPEVSSPITAMLPFHGDTLLLCTLKDGIHYLSGAACGPWRTRHDPFFAQHRIYCAARLPGGDLALGTSSGGLLVLDADRRLQRRLDKHSGLQNNSVLSLFSDRAGSLWLGLDTGIDHVAINSPFTSVFPDGILAGTGYTARVFDGRLYLGTSNGLYAAPWKPYYDPLETDVFGKVRRTDGQTWGLSAVGGELLLGHHEGAFRVEGEQAVPLAGGRGAWTFLELSPDLMLGGNYNGLALYRKRRGRWTFERQLNGLTESCRIMLRDEAGQIWVSHPYRGIYRVGLPTDGSGPTVDFFNSAHGLPSDLNNYVFGVQGKAVFTGERGIYQFDPASRRFVPHEAFQEALGNVGRVKYLREDEAGNIWYAAGEEVGVILVEDLGLTKRWRKRVFPELSGRLVGGFEFIYPLDPRNVFFAGEQGFIHLDPGRLAEPSLPQVVLGRVSLVAAPDSVVFGGWFTDGRRVLDVQPPGQSLVLPARLNGLHFAFSASEYGDPSWVEYRCRLDGAESGWSAWNGKPERDYINLPAGNYTFRVQARTRSGAESQELCYSFEILPPWYASFWAFSAYFCVLTGLLGLSAVRVRKRFEREKAELRSAHRQKEEQHLLSVARAEAELSQVRHEKLKAEIAFKNQELASATMHLVQKGEILLKVQESVLQLQEKSAHPVVKKELQHLLNLLDLDAKLDRDWEQFAYHFDQVHVDFLKRLREKYPQLSPNDHRLCAYLRMNISTKEIAPLMNISVRGVEASRYRLRKKLGLPNDANLTEVMMQV